jgi:hypothetical protein
MDLKQNSKKDYKNIRHTDDIELNGKIYYIPDKYLENSFLPLEQRKLYKYIIALFLDNYLNKYSDKHTDIHIDNNTDNHTEKKYREKKTLNKAIFLHYISLTDKIFSYLVTGKLYINTSGLSTIEKQIIERIPQNLVNQLNLMIVEKLE